MLVLPFIISILKSLANPAIWLVLTSLIWAWIARFWVCYCTILNSQWNLRKTARANKPRAHITAIWTTKSIETEWKREKLISWFQNGYNKVVIELRVVQFWFEIKLAITNFESHVWFRTKLHSTQFNYHYETLSGMEFSVSW